MFRIKKGAFMRVKRYTAIKACDAKRGCPTGRGALMAGHMDAPVPNAGLPNARKSDEALDLTMEQRLPVPNVDHLMASR
ncbi:hypothetical protein TSAR_007454 [Trichomalopsis sarcophagae]|uniref:Uncharacterized protein n=1 Tax=Trichomalopsis sarcophagae TaxID=543379 RepID=A0A232EJ21_9HYME|nr:hypothetical protein TSAR_007454 [Trichomalopsis sarcophagae]